jgi:hypothetical protein
MINEIMSQACIAPEKSEGRSQKAEGEELRRQRRMVDAAELITACSECLLEFCLLTSAF